MINDFITRLREDKRLAYIVLGLAALLGIILMVVFSSLLFCTPLQISNACTGASTADTVNDNNPSSTGIPTATPPGGVAQQSVGDGLQMLTEGIVGQSDSPITVKVGETSLPLEVDSPRTLDMGGKTFNIRSQGVDETGFWRPSVDGNEAAWMKDSIVNYVFALADTAENRDLITTLKEGELVTLNSAAGNAENARTFSMQSREILSVDGGTNGRDIFDQRSPGMTLILVGLGDEADQRVVVGFRHIPQEAQPSFNTDGTVVDGGIPREARLGDIITLGDLRIQMMSLATKLETTGAFEYQLVDYEIENYSGYAFNSDQLLLTLQDGAGNQYALNEEASVLGTNLPLPSTLIAQDKVAATAGYKVPAGVNTDGLSWIVQRLDSNQLVEFVLSDGDGSVADVASAQVSLQTAELSPDATALILNGTIANPTDKQLIIQQESVSLTNDQTTFLTLSSTGFPWKIEPGQTFPFTIMFQRPLGTPSAIFTVGKQPFQLSGWQ